MVNLCSLLALLLKEIDICAHRGFCMKFVFGQLLMEAFFDIIGTFGTIQSENEPTFPFQCIIPKMTNILSVVD